MASNIHTESDLPTGFADLPATQAEAPRRRRNWWQMALDYFAPVGYQDDTGFHHGEMPPPPEAARPGREDA